MNGLAKLNAYFDGLPIGRKLQYVIVAATGIALVLTALITIGLLVANDRRALVEHVSVLSGAIATNTTASLEFGDNQTATRLLGALKADSQVHYAALLDRSGALFASYQSESVAGPESLPATALEAYVVAGTSGHWFDLDSMGYVAPVLLEQQPIGFIYISTRLDGLYARVALSAVVMLGVLLGTGLASLVFTRRFQRRISNPILNLADAMDDVTHRQDFALRVPEGLNDETGRLISGFNTMLAGLEDRDERLERHRENLENDVRERTMELSQANGDLKLAVAEAESARDLAEQASRAKSEFLATMSHEIRTPMNGVLGMTELLLNTELTDRQKRFAEVIQRSGNSLLTIINDILDFSKIEAGKLELEDAEFNLRDLVDDVAELMAEPAHRKALELTVHCPVDLPTSLCGDAVRLRQVLVNLTGNAVKFTEHGEVTIQLSTTSVTADDVHLRVEVVDTGIGVTEEQRLRIFESFSQADSSTTRSYGGTGLGLAISTQLIKLMGGDIGVTSEVGEGSTFWFTVPLKRAAVSNLDSPRRRDLEGIRLLIVDDSQTNRAILQNQALDWGVLNDTASTGLSALEKLRNAAACGEPYDIAILDWKMPHTDGPMLTRLILEDPDIPTPKIVMLSSTVMDKQASNFEAAGVSCFLNKPIKQAALYEVLRGVLADVQQVTPAATNDTAALMFSGKVLVAEDNRVNQEVARNVLELMGCEVTIVADGKSAVDAASTGRFDLVLMDYHMPELDGWEASRAIRDLEAAFGENARRLPIVGLTADVQKEIPEKCLEYGMDAYMSKPFSQAQLAAQLARWLPYRQLPAQADNAVKPAHKSTSLDAGTVDRLRALGRPGAPSLLEQIAGIFLEDAPAMVASLRSAVETSDLPGLQDTAHSLKSSSANVGALRLSALCKQLESPDPDGDEALAALVAQITSESEAVFSDLRRIIEVPADA